MTDRTDTRTLRKSLELAGAFEPSAARSLGKLAVLLGAFAALVAGHALLGPWGWALLPLTALVAAAISITGHDGGHRSAFRTRRANDAILDFAMPFFGGVSGLYWSHKHNVLHHGSPNVHAVDPDLNLWPLACSREDYLASGPVRRWLQRHAQGWLLWPITALAVFSMRLAGLSHLVRHVRTRGLDRAALIDLGCLALHAGLWALPAVFVGWLPALLFYVAVWAGVGVYLGVIFLPAHMGLPIVSASDDLVRLTLATGRNFRMPRALAWFISGLDHQVEHHLWPKIPHRHLHRIAPLCREFAERLGLPYHEASQAHCLADTTRFFASAWRIEPVPMLALALPAEPVTPAAREPAPRACSRRGR